LRKLADLIDLSIAEFKRQIRIIAILCGSVAILAIALGSCGFMLLGLESGSQALEDAIVAFTLGGGGLAISGSVRAVAIALSLAGVIFISLIVSIITLTVQQKSMLKVAALVFSKEFRDDQEKAK
jgi:hypothetical protein